MLVTNAGEYRCHQYCFSLHWAQHKSWNMKTFLGRFNMMLVMHFNKFNNPGGRITIFIWWKYLFVSFYRFKNPGIIRFQTGQKITGNDPVWSSSWNFEQNKEPKGFENRGLVKLQPAACRMLQMISISQQHPFFFHAIATDHWKRW